MLIKLMKYDFRSMLRIFVPLWIAFLAVSIINRFTVSWQFDPVNYSAETSGLISGLLMMLYVLLMMAINIIGIIIVIQRFYNGLLKDEGYLMFTIPAKPWQLITSKGLTATVLILINAVISIVSVMILAIEFSFSEFMGEVFAFLREYDVSAGVLIFLFVVFIIISIMSSCAMVYASMSIGHLANKHRVGFSVLAYMGLSMTMSIATSILGLIFNYNDWLTNAIGDFLYKLSDVTAAYLLMIILIVIMAITTAIYYVITERILSKKLNLE